MSKKCDRCGTVCSDEEIFCAECGAELSSTESGIPATPKKSAGKRVGRLQKQREANLFSFNMLVSSFVDGEVFYHAKSVWSELLVAAFPIAAYAFFFLHIGLDKFFLSYIGGGRVITFFLLGIAYGLATVLLKAGVVFGADMLETKGKGTVNFFGCVRSIGLSHCVPASIALLGVLFRVIFGWSSLTFGLLSMLLNLHPYYSLLEAKLKNKYIVIAAVAVVGFIQCLAVSPLLYTKLI